MKDGEPVRGLTKENFEIYRGRERQKITGFDVIDLRNVTTATPPPSVLPPAARRHFLLLFDLTFSEPSSILKAREAAMKLVHDHLNPSDLVAVATYSFARGPRMILGFTSDRSQIDEAIRTLALPKTMPEPPDPLNLMIQGQEQAISSAKGSGLAAAARSAQRAATYNDLLELQQQGERATRQTQSNEVIAFSQSVTDLAKALATVQGRKYVVYLSEGFSGDVLSGGDASAATHQAIELGQTWQVDSREMFGNGRVQTDVEKMLEAFRRSDCIIESVDIGGLRASDAERQRPNGTASLFLLANDTGGELYQHFNNLGTAMQQMLDRTSVLYLLSFAPQDVRADGSYHRIRVKLVDAPSGARVVSRPGFFAPKAYSAMGAAEQRLENAGLIVGGEEGGRLPVSVLAAPFPLRGPDAKAYVPVLIEANGKMLLQNVKGPDAIIQIYVYALDPQGGIHDYRVQALRINVKQMGPAIESTGLKFFGHLDLAPGTYSIRTLVRNASSGIAAIRVLPLTVPTFGKPNLVLLRPLFPEKPGQWVIVREAVKSKAEKDVPYPFMVGGRPFIPAGSPDIAANSELPVYIVGYHLPKGELTFHAVVTRKDGTAVTSGRLSISGSLQAGSREAAALPATFDAKGLAPGHYEMRIEVKTATGSTESPPASFVVVGSKNTTASISGARV
ncbi:MAG TPA: VWA domain-containing protein, partial [Thermoanaerobaculia bacterium]|nr:VWA domain-containing protein [Thermoanaerobaculia bacterium]